MSKDMNDIERLIYIKLSALNTITTDDEKRAKAIAPLLIHFAKEAYNVGWFDKGLGDHPKDFEGWLELKLGGSHCH